ncbi:hypothetical protein ACQKWADRAFT_313602 [Trichoderma austrokoningii]
MARVMTIGHDPDYLRWSSYLTLRALYREENFNKDYAKMVKDKWGILDVDDFADEFREIHPDAVDYNLQLPKLEIEEEHNSDGDTSSTSNAGKTITTDALSEGNAAATMSEPPTAAQKRPPTSDAAQKLRVWKIKTSGYESICFWPRIAISATGENFEAGVSE